MITERECRHCHDRFRPPVEVMAYNMCAACFSGERCELSQRVDGKAHSWKWASDGPYIVCHYCGELRDALSGRVLDQPNSVTP